MAVTPVIPVSAFQDFSRILETTVLRNLKEITQALKSFATLIAAESWLKPITQKIGDTFTGMAQKVGGWLKPLTDKMGSVLETLGRQVEPWLKPVTQKIGALGSHLGETLGPALGGALRGFKGIAVIAGVAGGAIAGLGLAIGQFVKLANPAVFELFNRALMDTMAVVGRALVPVLQVVTEILRSFGDTLATFADAIGQGLANALKAVQPLFSALFDVFGRIGQAVGGVATALAPAFEALGEAIGAILDALQPVINLVIDLFAGALKGAFELLANMIVEVTPYIITFAKVIGDVVEFMQRGIRDLLALIGIDLKAGGPGTAPGASVGAAVRSASHGSIESVIQEAQRSALTLGAGSASPAAKTASAAEAINKRVDELYSFVQGIPTEIGNTLLSLPGAMIDLIENWWAGTRGASGSATSTVEGTAGRLARREGIADPEEFAKMVRGLYDANVKAGVGDAFNRAVADAKATRAAMTGVRLFSGFGSGTVD